MYLKAEIPRPVCFPLTFSLIILSQTYKKLIGQANVSYQCIWGGGGQNKKVQEVIYIGEQDREECMCVGPNKSRRQTSGGVPEVVVSAEEGTDVRC